MSTTLKRRSEGEGAWEGERWLEGVKAKRWARGKACGSVKGRQPWLRGERERVVRILSASYGGGVRIGLVGWVGGEGVGLLV